MKNCNGCKWAGWKKTKSGELDPDGTGLCFYPVKTPELPNGFVWLTIDCEQIGISRYKDFDNHCKFYEHIK